MSLAYYYEQLKGAGEIALVKPALAEVTTCTHKHNVCEQCCTDAEERRSFGGPQPAGDSGVGGAWRVRGLGGAGTVTHGVYTGVSQHQLKH